jgi:hypothetical protein
MRNPDWKGRQEMRRTFVVVIILLSTSLSSADAGDHRTFGLGIALGEPTGLSAKWFLSDSSALDLDLAYALFEGSAMFTMDYLYHFQDVLHSPVVWMRPYIGGGGVLAGRTVHEEETDHDHHKHEVDKDVLGVGGRFTAGLSFLFTEVPIELFVDISPGIWLVPETDFMWGAVLGARYFF